MGLDIFVDGKCYYDHSYGAIHTLRLFAARFEYPDVTKETLYEHPYYRFRALIDHSDCGDGYIPEGTKAPEPRPGVSPAFQWPTTEALLWELNELGKYKGAMDDDVRGLYEELLAAAKASIETQKPIEFG